MAGEQEGFNLVVAAFHHPYNWLESNSARSFRDNIESTADLVLTGHEHRATMKTQEGYFGQRNLCVEGGVLQDNKDSTLSDFNVFIFDTNERKRKFGNYRWNGLAYTLTDMSSSGDAGGGLGWSDYQINDSRVVNLFQISGEMRERLAELGVDLNHRERGPLLLQDVYLYPDLIEMRTRGDRFGRRISADSLIDILEPKSTLIITGDTDSGKTSLAKMLFLALLERGVVPVLLDGTQRPPRGDRVHGYIDDVFAGQYNPALLDPYRQLDRSSRAVIIDDYDHLQLSSTEKKSFLHRISNALDYVVIFSHDISSDLDELTHPSRLLDSPDNTTHFRIQPFGYAGRNKLTERWMLLGGEVDVSEKTFVQSLARTNDLINTLVGKNYLPSYPVYVLSVLQALDSATPIDITASTHGYFYELFIKASLARGRTSIAFDIIASYLAYVAYQMHVKNVMVLSDNDLKKIHQGYEDHYDIDRPYSSTKNQLLNQNIFVQVNDMITFKYSYLYNYFLASYLRDHVTESVIRDDISEICHAVHIESNANILLFLAHLCRDPVVIGELLVAAEGLYNTYSPAQLGEDVAFIGDMTQSLPDTIYEENDPRANREAILVEMDRESPPDVGLANVDSFDEEPGVDLDDPIVFVNSLPR